MKRILTIQDLSCLGKCSLTIALPLLSAMGLETVVLPTALLSTHSRFRDFTFHDLSDQILPITAHWKKEGAVFDAIYTGYLGSEREIDLVKKVISDFRREDTLVFVDPVMGDHGKLYAGFDGKYLTKNRELCEMADIIVPNLTEAAFLTGTAYQETDTEEEIVPLLLKLLSLGPKSAVITGVSLSEGEIGAAGMESAQAGLFSCQSRKLPALCHGTGDIFSSVTVGGLLRGLSLADAVKLAVDFTEITIEETMKRGTDLRYGVAFEAAIPELVRMLSACANP